MIAQTVTGSARALMGAAALSLGLTTGARTQLAFWMGGTAVWVYSMVVLGGVTRLTRSGLSMTDWKFTGGSRDERGLQGGCWPESIHVCRQGSVTLKRFAHYWVTTCHRQDISFDVCEQGITSSKRRPEAGICEVAGTHKSHGERHRGIAQPGLLGTSRGTARTQDVRSEGSDQATHGPRISLRLWRVSKTPLGGNTSTHAAQ